MFLTKITEFFPKDMALSKFHLVNQIRNGDKVTEIERVATYEQFLELCGDINKRYVDLIKSKNILAKVKFQNFC